MARKRRQSQNEEPLGDEVELDDEVRKKAKSDDDEDEGEEDRVDLDEVEDDDDDEEEEGDEAVVGVIGASVEDLEKKRLFLSEAEEAMDSLTLDDIREVLKDNEMDPKWASRLKKLLSEVVEEGDVSSMEEAWEEALGRLDEEM